NGSCHWRELVGSSRGAGRLRRVLGSATPSPLTSSAVLLPGVAGRPTLPLRAGMCGFVTSENVTAVRPTDALGRNSDIGDNANNLLAPQCVLMRTEAGWPGNLNRFPVSLISVPLTFRMEISWSR